MSVRLRLARKSDRAFLHACLVELRESDVRIDPWKLVVRAPESDAQYSSAMLRRYRENHGFVLIAELDGVPAGFVAGWVYKYSKLERLIHRPNRRGHISEVVVLEAFRLRGIGSTLLQAAEERLRKDGCDIVGLDVSSSNSEARRLYARSGYAPSSLYLRKRTIGPFATWAGARKPHDKPKRRRAGRRLSARNRTAESKRKLRSRRLSRP